MKRAYKFRIYPNEEQRVLIDKTIGCARLMYNLLLGDYKEQLDDRTNGQSVEMKSVKHFKEEYDFLSEVDSLALMNARQNLRSSLDNFFKSRKGKRKGRKIGFPRFKSKARSKLRYTTNNQKGTVAVDEHRSAIKIPKLKWVKANLHRQVLGSISMCTVEHRRSGEYYVSIVVERDVRCTTKNIPLERQRVVGIDMSLTSFAVDSDKSNDVTKTKYVREYRENERRLKRLQRSVSRKQKGSMNRDKARMCLARFHEHIANKRKDFCHKESLRYARDYDVIVIEDLDMQAMSRTLHLGKSVMDLGWGEFTTFLKYKCEEHGSILVVADKWFASSKICHECGEKNTLLKLSDREWVCPHCGCVIDRDYNAALNLRDYYYNTVWTTGIHACGEETTTSVETLVQATSLKQEAPNF